MLFEKKGGKLLDGTKVQQIHPGSTVRVVANGEQYQAKSLVITAGPWAKDVLQSIGVDVPLKVDHCMHAHVQ